VFDDAALAPCDPDVACDLFEDVCVFDKSLFGLFGVCFGWRAFDSRLAARVCRRVVEPAAVVLVVATCAVAETVELVFSEVVPHPARPPVAAATAMATSMTVGCCLLNTTLLC
jgi:hypothetical protein